MPTLTLYHLDYCPYCHLVRRAADRLRIDLRLVEISAEPSARAKLIHHLGRGTVPVLGIEQDGEETLLPESADIVRWLETHASTLTA